MPESLSLLHTVRPAAQPLDARPPLLILLHGIGGNERQMAPLASVVDARFTVVAARSPIALAPDSFAWFHATFAPLGAIIDAAEAAAGWALAADFAAEAVDAYDADPQRVYIGGFSQGGIIGLSALLTSPERFAGAVVLSGRLLPEVLPSIAEHDRLQRKAVLLVHGDRDVTIRIDRARWSREQLARLPLDLTFRELPIGHTIAPATVAELTEWLTSRLA